MSADAPRRTPGAAGALAMAKVLERLGFAELDVHRQEVDAC